MSVEPIHLSRLGSGPDAVLRIVAYFDELDEACASVDTVIRSAALAAECPVGARWASGTVVRYDATGALEAGGDLPVAPAQRDEPAVWLERTGAAHALDPVLVDRVRHLLRMAATRVGVPVQVGDPALLEVVLSEKAPRAERARAIRLLGFDESREIRILAISADSPAAALRAIAGELTDQPVRSVVTDRAAALLCYATEDARTLSDRLDAAIAKAVPPRPAGSGRGWWVGIGTSTNVFAASTSWQQALRALRFASSTAFGRRAVAYERLSALELLADLPLEQVLRHRDIARINQLAATPTGAHEVDTAEAFCVLGSLRGAATHLHLHHSTVAARLARVETAMGWDLSDPVDKFMATLVLVVRRICMSSVELTAGNPPFVGQARH